MIILLYLSRPRGAEDTPIGIFISQKMPSPIGQSLLLMGIAASLHSQLPMPTLVVSRHDTLPPTKFFNVDLVQRFAKCA